MILRIQRLVMVNLDDLMTQGHDLSPNSGSIAIIDNRNKKYLVLRNVRPN